MFTVSNLLDDGSPGTLRNAINLANANPGADSIDFGATGTLRLSGSQLPPVLGNLTIAGPGASLLTIDAQGASRILQVNSGVTVSVSGLTLANGTADFGGGILNDGTLTLHRSVVSGNHGRFSSGGIDNNGTLSVLESTLSGNSSGGNGGGIINRGTLSLTGSTLVANSSSYTGGGILNVGTVSLTNSTLSGNFANTGGAIDNNGNLAITNSTLTGNSANLFAGGIRNTLTLFLNNTLVVNNTIVTQVLSNPDIGGLFTGTHNLFGTIPLGPLANNGGPTLTHALAAGSPAIDAGNPALPSPGTPTKDQRGFWRDAAPDIGAYETGNRIFVTTLADENNGDIAESLGTGTSLREAMAFSPGVSTKTIRFLPSLTLPGTIRLTLGALPDVTNQLTVIGPGASQLTVDAQGASRIVRVAPGADVTLSGLTLANGSASTGGAILNQGSLTVTHSALSGNQAASGGAVSNQGTLTLISSTVQGNAATGTGGAILNDGTLTLTNNTFTGNSAQDGGAIYNTGTMSITQSTLSGNSATQGGGVYSRFVSAARPGTTTLTNSIVGGNTLASGGTPSDLAGNVAFVAASRHNLIGPGGSGGLVNGTNSNIVVSSVAALGLGTVGNFGGQTRTVPLLSSSPAINAADPALAPSLDQRGAPRAAAPDIGAFEVVQQFVITTLTDEDNMTIDPGLGAGTSLHEAMTFANLNPGADSITFASGGTLLLNGSQLPAVSDVLTITGPGAGVTIDAQLASRIFQINAGTSVSLNRLALVNGNASDFGGGILNDGTLTLTNSTLASNSAQDGGAIYNTGTMSITQSTLSGNSATRGGGVYSRFVSAARPGTTTLTNSIVGGNTLSSGMTPSDLAGNVAVVATSRHNLIGPGGNGGLVNGTNGNIVVGSVAALGLGTVGNFGGLIQTVPLFNGSPAINAADPALAPSLDQRGAPRAAAPDIGAFEVVQQFVITTLTDEDNMTIDPGLGAGTSLREAMTFANLNPGADSITFASGGTLLLNGSQLPAVNDGLTITGPGAGLTINAQLASRIFQINAGINVTLNRLALVNGNADFGGAIRNEGGLTITNSTLSGNTGSFRGGSIWNARYATVSLVASSLSGNSAPLTGGGIFSYGTLSVTDSTLTGNTAGSGGALYNHSSGTLTVTNSTFVGNSAGSQGGGIWNGGASSVTNATFFSNSSAGGTGGIFSSFFGSLALNNTIAVTSTIFGVTSGGNNLSDDIRNSLGLGALGDYSGPTGTIPLLPGSPAINAGNPALAPAADQRGLARDAQPDIGAFEVTHPNLVVTTLVDEDDGTFFPSFGTGTSLREALSFASKNPGADTITIAVSGTILLNGTQLPAITDELTVITPATGVTIDAQHASRILQINAGAQVALNNLTLINGQTADSGGAVLNSGTLALSDVSLTGNAAGVDGGALWNSGSLALTRTTFNGNTASRDGGGLWTNGPLTLTDSTFSNNAATRDGGGVFGTAALIVSNSTLSGNSAQNNGGGMASNGSLTLTNSHFTNNDATHDGGGIFGGTATVRVSQSTLSGNSAQNGGGIANNGPLTLTDSSLTNNLASANGGGVAGTGTITMNNGSLSGNTAQNGGGIWGGSSLSLTGATVVNNTASLDGGGLWSGGPLTMTGSTVDNNQATREGGGLFGGSTSLNVSNSTFSENSAQNGGGIASSGSLTLTNASLIDNVATGNGGGINGTGTFTANNSTISGNSAQSGGGIRSTNTLSLTNATLANNTATQDGGGVFSSGSVSMSLTTLSGNSSGVRGGGISANSGTLTVTNSTLSGNSAQFGGGVFNQGALTLTNSTIVANSTTGNAGGVSNRGTLTLTNSTIVNNSTTGTGGGVYNAGIFSTTNATISGNTAGSGGGVYSQYLLDTMPGVTTLTNSIVGGNTLSDGATPTDLAGNVAVVATSSHNLIGPGGSGGLLNGTNSNIVVASVAALGLGTPGNYGGTTLTVPLLRHSPALEQANPTLAPLADQRGVARIGRPDSGSFEFTAFLPSLVVTTLVDEDNGTSDPIAGFGTSLREAIHYANNHPGADTITFTVTGTMILSGELPTLGDSATIAGPGKDNLTIKASGFRVLATNGASVTLRGLTLTEGLALNGGAIHNSGSLRVEDSAITNSIAGGGNNWWEAYFNGGGAIANHGNLELVRTTILGNRSSFEGGALYNAGTALIEDSTLTNNETYHPGSIQRGGSISNWGTLTIRTSTISGSASTYGGGIFNAGNLTLADSTLSGNSTRLTFGYDRSYFAQYFRSRVANYGGGALCNFMAKNVTVTNCTFTGNSSIDKGGAIANSGHMQVSNSSFDQSSAHWGGAIFTDGPRVIFGTVYGSSLAITGSTFTNNSAHFGAFANTSNSATLDTSRFTNNGNEFTNVGGIYNQGDLSVSNSQISENTGYQAGGIDNAGSLHLSNSLVSGNSGQFAGGIHNAGALSVTNSTISGNTGLATGGGLYNDYGGSATLTNTTITGNRLTYLPRGGGIFHQGSLLRLNNTIVGGNEAADIPNGVGSFFANDVVGSVDASSSHNLFGPGGSGGLTHGVHGNIIVTNTANLGLAPLADNGGPTRTHALLAGSPAHDAGSPLYTVEVLGDPLPVVSDPSFETPALAPTAFAYRPSGSPWTFTGSSGLASNGSAFNNATAPQGSQVAFLQGGDSSISQVVTLDAGTYVLAFRSSQRLSNQQTFRVLVDGNPVAEITPVGGGVFATYATDAFTVTGGSHTIQFVGLNPRGGDNTAFLDQIEIVDPSQIRFVSTLPATDQRGTGFARSVGTVDIGAYEAQTPQNQAPTDVALSNATIAENQPADTVVGSFSTTDPDLGDTFTYALVSGTGSEDNASFTIDANGNLKTAASFDFETKSSYSIRVRSTDAGGLSFEKVFLVSVTNVNEAPVADVNGPSSGVRGQRLTFPLSANDPDVGDNAAGFTFAINWGDGSAVEYVGPGSLSGATASHVYAVSGSYTVRVTATDRHGLTGSEDTTTVNVSAILFQNGVLLVGGTTSADEIEVNSGNAGLRVVLGGITSGPYAGVTAVEVYGQAGADDIRIASGINLPGLIDGGADNDILRGGGGANVILGGAGDDEIYGRGGRDLLIGGLGSDTLLGGSGEDILIGGTTDHDENKAALDAIMAEWTRTDANYITRIGHLRDGSAGGLNGVYRLNETTVHDDAAIDDLSGGQNLDWYLALAIGQNADRINSKNGEIVTPLL